MGMERRVLEMIVERGRKNNEKLIIMYNKNVIYFFYNLVFISFKSIPLFDTISFSLSKLTCTSS